MNLPCHPLRCLQRLLGRVHMPGFKRPSILSCFHQHKITNNTTSTKLGNSNSPMQNWTFQIMNYSWCQADGKRFPSSSIACSPQTTDAKLNISNYELLMMSSRRQTFSIVFHRLLPTNNRFKWNVALSSAPHRQRIQVKLQALVLKYDHAKWKGQT